MAFDITPYVDMSPKKVRELIRKGVIDFPTAGMCRGYAQANMDAGISSMTASKNSRKPVETNDITSPHALFCLNMPYYKSAYTIFS